MLYIGEYTCKVDEKGRVALPSAFRGNGTDVKGIQFTLKKDLFFNCLVLYSMSEWEKQISDLDNKLNPHDPTDIALRRKFFRDATLVEVDAAGRILIPKRLWELIEVSKEVVFAGQNSKIEIWAKEAYGESDMSIEEYQALTKEKLIKK